MRWPVLLLALGLALVNTSGASTVPRHSPADNGWIAFASDRVTLPYSSYGLYRLDPIGAKVTRLGMLTGRSPAWSPDGAWIAFSDRRQRLIVAAADGTNARRLTDRPVIAEEPAWSPDGSRIVFQHAVARGGRGRDLAVINANGTNLHRITRGPYHDLQPAWSPDGSLIAFSTNRGPVRRFSEQDEIYVVRPNGSGLRALTNNEFGDFSPAWSPDGRVIASSSGRRPGGLPELWAMRSDGTGARRVQPAASPSGLPVWSDHNPSWSPDGNWLVYASTETPHGTDVFIVRPDGTDKIDLTPGTNSQDFDPAWQPQCSRPGTRGGDRLQGTRADDRVCGFAGNDVISGGTGRDGLYGGEGNDVIRSRDASFDVVGCGDGSDSVVADRGDLVGVDCERVRRV